jgi:hypothetical protein
LSMDEQLDEFGMRLGRALRSATDSVLPARDPRKVVAGIAGREGQSWLRWATVPVAAAVIALGAVGVSAYLAEQQKPDGESSSAETVVFNGTTYQVSLARGMVLPDLLPVAGEVSSADPALVEGTTAYSIPGIPATIALVMPAAEGAEDEVGPIGEYVLLIGPDADPSDLCVLFAGADQPAEC